MLSITFYDNIKYHRQDFMNRDSDFFGNGVVALTHFPYTVQSDSMNIQIGAGVAWVDGYRIANDSDPMTLTVPAADVLKRIDIVQIGHDDINSEAVLMIKKGVASSNPVEPDADPSFLKVYSILVPANATSIVSSNITDRRARVTLNVDASQLQFGGYTAQDVLAKLLTVDGSGSGLDADMLDGKDSSSYALDNNHYAYANQNGVMTIGSANTLYNLPIQTTGTVQGYNGVNITNAVNAINITKAGKYLVILQVEYSGANAGYFVDALIRRTFAGGGYADAVNTQQGASGAGGNSGGWNVINAKVIDLAVGDALTFWSRASEAPRNVITWSVEVIRISA